MSVRRNPLFLWLIAICVCALFLRLGFWQLERGREKQRMLDRVAHVLHQRHALPLTRAAELENSNAYDWADGEGVFADAPSLLLDNQQRDGQVGVRAYRVFVPSQGAPMLIELGWLPLPGTRVMPAVPRPSGSLRIEGLLMPLPSHGIGVPAIQPQSDGTLLLTGLELPALRAALHQPLLASRLLRLAPELPLGYTRDLDILPNTLPPERHLGYAVQWFALAAAVFVTALVLSLRRRRASLHSAES